MTTNQDNALKQAQAVLRGLTFKDDKITGALEAIYRAMEAKRSAADEGWQQLPGRLRGRGDYLRDSGHVKDAELMYDAAAEIEDLRSRK